MAHWGVIIVVVLSLMTLSHCDDSTLNVPSTFTWAIVRVSYIDPMERKIVKETFEGKYGVKSLVESETGILVHAVDEEKLKHGCDNYHGSDIPDEPWIALVERGHCYFTDKITVATKKYNASAVVVYDNVEGHVTIMQHTVEDEVSIFVARDTGVRLVKLVEDGVRVKMTISPGKKEYALTPPTDNFFNRTGETVLIITGFLVLTLLNIGFGVFWCRKRKICCRKRRENGLSVSAHEELIKGDNMGELTVTFHDKAILTENPMAMALDKEKQPV